MRYTRFAVAAAAASSLGTSSAFAVVAASVGSYTPGDFSVTGTSTNYQNASAALGMLSGDTGFGGLNPFNPAFSTSQIVAVGAGGQLTLHLSSPAPVTAGTPTLGVFVNNGIIDVSGGSGTAGTPAQTFSDLPRAVVSVSRDGANFVDLFGGAAVTFSVPTNYYTDGQISNYNEPLGSAVADQFKPFTGTLSSFDGETFGQIKTTLAGSAGGTWLDLSGSGLSSVTDVRFAVPAGATYRMFVDSVSAVPEPATIGLAAVAAAGLLVGRRRVR